jgi:hypothetical protein
MISVFESDSKIDTDAVAHELRAARIACFVDGEATASLPGLYVPQVLRVCVLDASALMRAKRIAAGVVARLHGAQYDEAKGAPRKRRWIVWIGVALMSLSAAGALLALVTTIGRRIT